MDSNCKTKYNLDHVYCHPNDGKYIRANSGPTEVLSILKENKQLKAMLLLHLDLIQEQSDQLMAKDRMLASLREENESLKQRVERMDKRLLKNKTVEQVDLLPQIHHVGLDKKDNIPKLRMVNSKPATVTQFSAPATETRPVPSTTATVPAKPSQSTESKYKICDDNYNVENHIIGHNNGKYITKIVLQRVQSPTGDAKSPRLRGDEEPDGTAGGSRSPVTPATLLETTEQVDEVMSEQAVIATTTELAEDNFSCGSGAEQDYLGVQTRRKHPIRYGNLVTKKLFCTREWESEKIEEDLNREETEALQSECPNLEIPKWTIKEFHGLYAIEGGSGKTDNLQKFSAQQEDSRSSCESEEISWNHNTTQDEVNAEDLDSINTKEIGTEDLSDDVFFKRHNKLELDERRRKKWDVQRIREQRTIERLKRRHCKEPAVELHQSQIQDSFYPSVDQIKFIQITDEIPVNAFGEIIPHIKDEHFNLPWPDTSHFGFNHNLSVMASATSPTSPFASVTPASTTLSTSATTSFERCTRRSNSSNIGSSTALLILKKRRRQHSHTTNSKRSHRKIMVKN